MPSKKRQRRQEQRRKRNEQRRGSDGPFDARSSKTRDSREAAAGATVAAAARGILGSGRRNSKKRREKPRQWPAVPGIASNSTMAVLLVAAVSLGLGNPGSGFDRLLWDIAPSTTTIAAGSIALLSLWAVWKASRLASRVWKDNANGAKALHRQKDNDDPNETEEDLFSTLRPLGLRRSREAPPKLASSEAVRARLAEWLPFGLRHTSDLELVYSTSVHGRSLRVLYHRLSEEGSRHTVLFAEVLPAKASKPEPGSLPVVGMYASHRWKPSPGVYGDGQSFLFRAEVPETEGEGIGAGATDCRETTRGVGGGGTTNEAPPLRSDCWKWTPPPPPERPAGGGSSHCHYHVGRADGSAAAREAALWETFQRSNGDSLALGISGNGAGAGLSLNSDLTQGESHRAVGFDNEPLAGAPAERPADGNDNDNDSKLSAGVGSHRKTDGGVVFGVGLVEVYQLVREIDGLPIK